MKARVGTWNCRQRLDAKLDAVSELACDVLVVPECSRAVELASHPEVSFAWRGDYAHKGLGVFGFNGWSVEPLVEADSRPWCLPISVAAPDAAVTFTLLAVWTVKNSGDGRPSYAAQFADVIQRWSSVIRSSPVALAGDLNASVQGSSARSHLSNLEALRSLDAHSAFHHNFGVEHGSAAEPPTLRWIGPGGRRFEFHCDYIFLSSQLLPLTTAAAVGSTAEWIDSGRSDHCPVTVELDFDEPHLRSGT
ncbi:MAG: hypothetical protein Q7V57_18615 [Actinomycetota bacterium]|nr:hypothetical protein [Actinomycetota bacterium]